MRGPKKELEKRWMAAKKKSKQTGCIVCRLVWSYVIGCGNLTGFGVTQNQDEGKEKRGYSGSGRRYQEFYKKKCETLVGDRHYHLSHTDTFFIRLIIRKKLETLREMDQK